MFGPNDRDSNDQVLIDLLQKLASRASHGDYEVLLARSYKNAGREVPEHLQPLLPKEPNEQGK